MSTFFRNFPIIEYRFGDEVDPNLFQNVSAYVDLIDQFADDATFYEKYTILDGDRPDTVSQKLYGTTDFYWTFYLLNDTLRSQGWPLTQRDLNEKVNEYYPNTTLSTQDDITDKFFVGDIAATKPFDSGQFRGVIIEKNFELGQVVVNPLQEINKVTITNGGSGYTSVPTITITGGNGANANLVASLDSDKVDRIFIVSGGDGYTVVPNVTISAPDVPRGTQATATVTIANYEISENTVIHSEKGVRDPRSWDVAAPFIRTNSVLPQKNSVHHYEDSSGNHVDPGLDSAGFVNLGPSGLANKIPVTYLERLESINDNLASIKVFKPSVITQVDQQFQKLLKQQ